MKKTMKKIYRKDYQASAYLIKTTQLTFTLGETETLVTAVLTLYKNPKIKTNNQNLFLNGKQLELLSIQLNDKAVAHQLKPNGLHIKGTIIDDAINCNKNEKNNTGTFLLTIKTKIFPQQNKSLNGLYQSDGVFCTQCEPHGFQHITYYLDRPDVLSVFTTTIIADKNKYPVLLANGNLIANQGESVTWFDPYPKPCYLFALVAGNLAVLNDFFISKTGEKIALKIFVKKHNLNKTDFAMQALKKAMRWDEQRFNLSYDLDTYMIVAVDDFNMGAMENKGLNIFNSQYVLANKKTATDDNFIDIEAIIGHEYFHNWTGNRVTCRDWFQLSLKEGLTVFRDQEFTADLHDKDIKRIDDVCLLKNHQFLEDAGPMAHAVRPDAYLEVNNFYTATVYEKGAELVRMLHTFLGEQHFQKGIQRYLKKFDGTAATIDDFLIAMTDNSTIDLKQFQRWYEQKNTPVITVISSYNVEKKTLTLDCTQDIATNKPFIVPIKYGLISASGKEIDSGLLTLKKSKQQFIFKNIKEKTTASLLRDFSAPVILKSNLSSDEKIFLVKHDSNAFNRWQQMQQLWLDYLNSDEKPTDSFFSLLKDILKNDKHHALVAELLTLPSERELHQQAKIIDVFAIHNKRQTLIKNIAEQLKAQWLVIIENFSKPQNYQLNPKQVGKRRLKNLALFYYQQLADDTLIIKQYQNADNMTDKLTALRLLENSDYWQTALDGFYNDYQNDVQVIDKWFAIQAGAKNTDRTIIKKLMSHTKFSTENPNRLRALLGTFTQNYCQFHNKKGYQLVTDTILKLDKSNPQMAARFVGVFNHWRRFTDELAEQQKQCLNKIAKADYLSDGVFEIVQNALKEK